MTGRRGDPPTPVGPPVIDAGTGHLAALAISAALYERERSGQGQRVSVSLTATSLSLQSQEATLYLNTGTQPQRSEAGVANPYFVAPYGVYETADGHLALAHTSLPRLSEVLGEPGLARYETADRGLQGSRRDLQAAGRRLKTGLDRGLAGPAGAGRLLGRAGARLPAVLRSVRRCVRVRDAGRERRRGAEHRLAGAAGTHAAQARTAPPRLGAHTAQVLSDLGYDDNAIATLRSDGAI